MKLLAVSDLHGDEEALAKLKVRAADYDCVLVAGDIAGGRGFAEELVSASERMFIIPGNGDRDFLKEVAGRKWLHGKRAEIGEGLNLVGFGYSPPTPFGTPGEFPEEKLYGWMKGLPIDAKTILVTHAPPYGMMDEARGEHAGSRAVLRIIEEGGPLMNVCGHIHEREGVRKHGGTTVLKVGAANGGRCGEIEAHGGKIACRNTGL